MTATTQAADSNDTKLATDAYVDRAVMLRIAYAADAGSTDAYAITITPAPAAYVTGMMFVFKANTINTGACSLQVNALAVIPIKKKHDQDPADGDIEAGQMVSVIYDGTNFQMQSQIAN